MCITINLSSIGSHWHLQFGRKLPISCANAAHPANQPCPIGKQSANNGTHLQPTTLKAPFLEQFTDDWESRWKPSHAKKDTKGSDKDEEWAYVGEWSVEEPHVFKGMEGDKGLVVKNPAAHHAISAKFPEKVDPKGKPLVVQYEVKLQSMFYNPSCAPTT